MTAVYRCRVPAMSRQIFHYKNLARWNHNQITTGERGSYERNLCTSFDRRTGEIRLFP